MAASKSCYRYLPSNVNQRNPSDSSFELDESDVWNSATSASPEFRHSVPSIRRKPSSAVKIPDNIDTYTDTQMAGSMPVNVPDWSVILKNDKNEKRWGGDDGGDDDVYGGVGRSWVPPHEFLAKTRIASFSVQEGMGRTLKGRDLRRVRNAIWEKTGFQD